MLVATLVTGIIIPRAVQALPKLINWDLTHHLRDRLLERPSPSPHTDRYSRRPPPFASLPRPHTPGGGAGRGAARRGVAGLCVALPRANNQNRPLLFPARKGSCACWLPCVDFFLSPSQHAPPDHTDRTSSRCVSPPSPPESPHALIETVI